MNELKISLKYLNGIYLPKLPNKGTRNSVYALSIAAEIMRLGFVPSEGLVRALSNLSEATFYSIYRDIIQVLREKVGDNVTHQPFYPNFPKQVMEAHHIDLFFNAIVHYWSLGTWKPEYDKLPREFAFENVTFKEIGLVTAKEFNAIPDKLVSANESLSQTDKDTIQWFIDNQAYNPAGITIPFKENMCILAANALNQGLYPEFTTYVKTATDVLRVVTYMNGGDVSLAGNTKFKSMPRKIRRVLSNVLENIATEEDIQRHRNKWIKLFHSLHVGEYSKTLRAMAGKFRSGEKIDTYNGKVRYAINHKHYLVATKLLKTRPGEFARKLDELVRKSDRSTADRIVEDFGKICEKINTRVLIQLWGHFQNRTKTIQDRLFFPKGGTQKSYLLSQSVSPLPLGVPDEIVTTIYTTLNKRFKELPKIDGKVWVDPALYHCPVPTQQRSASEGLFQAARGTRMPLEDKEVLRLFLYWVGADIDLSATFHDEEFNQISDISYTCIKNRPFGAYHSGDIVQAPKGASEFIDIDLNQAFRAGARYVMMNVYVFAGGGFDEHKTCFVGWMGRDKPMSNEIYDPKTVVQKIDLTGESQNAIPVIFDLKERKVIWTDLYTTKRMRFGGNNVHSNKATTQRVLQGMLGLDSKLSLFELLSTHVTARSDGFAKSREEADVVYGFEGDVTPFDITTINSDFVVG